VDAVPFVTFAETLDPSSVNFTEPALTVALLLVTVAFKVIICALWLKVRFTLLAVVVVVELNC
jgi:hypothetical protein